MSTILKGALTTAWTATALGVAALVFFSDGFQLAGSESAETRPASAIPLAVLGDSDSHSYQDKVSFPAGSEKRGGAYRAITLQWTEVLARLRAQELDQGEWGVWGVHRVVARVQDWVGLQNRAPRKEDYQYNFAISGAGCETLTTGGGRQVQRLLALMDREPARWREGVVVLRIGVNSFGMDDGLEQFARDPMAAGIQGEVSQCLSQVRTAIALVHAKHPQTRFVLVGIFDNTHWPRYFGRWQSPEALANVARGLDVYDKALQHLAAADPRLAFFDDRGWFAARWGTHDAQGRPAYRPVVLASGLKVHNTIGDEPHHAVIADGHAGLVWNVLWTQSLVELLNRRLDMKITPIGDAEASRLVDSLLASNR